MNRPGGIQRKRWDTAVFFRRGTSSFAQIRRPLYRSSIGSALPLMPHVGPLTDALGDLAPAARCASDSV